MWTVKGVDVRQEVDASKLRWPPIKRSYDVIALNYEHVDIELTYTEARDVVEEEAELIRCLEQAGDDDGSIAELLAGDTEDFRDTADLDVGMAGVVAALAASGATTISSCNGGTLDGCHQMDAPTVLFACPKLLLPKLIDIAKATGCGLIDNGGFLELFTDDLRKMNVFAQSLLRLDPSR